MQKTETQLSGRFALIALMFVASLLLQATPNPGRTNVTD
jgi:hypothetical protein